MCLSGTRVGQYCSCLLSDRLASGPRTHLDLLVELDVLARALEDYRGMISP